MLSLPGSSLSCRPARHLQLHEYQSKELMDKYGVSTQIGLTASSPEEAAIGARKLLTAGVGTVVIKAQVFAGGRGKGTLSSGLKGGVQFVKNSDDARKLAELMLGHKLVTHQTTSEGLEVRKLLLTEGVSIDREFYLAIVLDRSQGGPCVVCSREGGMDIEEVSKNTPEAVHVIPVDINWGITDEICEAVAQKLLPDADSSIPKNAKNLPTREKNAMHSSLKFQLKKQLKQLYQLFLACDASQIEINPLAVTSDERVLCVDAKLEFDDNAQFRQKELFAQEDRSVRCERELAAEELHMNYVSMSGSVGCLVNGAGLAMATMDLLTFHGGSAANFLDLGGGATKEQVLKSFQILTSDPNVKVILVNIFGGITRCDVVAQGILDAAKQCKMDRPLVVRLAGNNAQKAKAILDSAQVKAAGLTIHYVQDFSNAAKTAVDIAAGSSDHVAYTQSA